LVDVSDVGAGAEMQSGGNLPQLKVPRRLRKAFDRLNRPATPPRQLMGFTLLLLVFAGGVLLGRLGGVPGDGPDVRTTLAQPLRAEVSGSLGYMARVAGSSSGEPALVRHDVLTGQIDHVARFTLPFEGRERTLVRSLEGSVALVVTDGDRRSHVAAFPVEHDPLLWLDGLEAVWESADVLLVLQSEGHLVRWTFGPQAMPRPVDGPWIDIRQTASGAVLEGERSDERFLALATSTGIVEKLPVPQLSRVLAVAGSGSTALLSTGGRLELWDGSRTMPVDNADGFDALSASFSKDHQKVAVTLVSSDDRSVLLLGVVGMDGGMSIRRVSSSAQTEKKDCENLPAWDPSGRWLYVVPGDGSVYAAEVGGGRMVRASPRIVGCGVAWSG
jgi:hypothetical protein